MSNCCKIINVVGNAGSPSKADRKLAVPRRTGSPSRCNCYKIRGKHNKNDCAQIPDTRPQKRVDK